MSDAFYSHPVPNLKQTLVESLIQSSKITKIYNNKGSFTNLFVSYFLILCSNIRYKNFLTNLNRNRKLLTMCLNVASLSIKYQYLYQSSTCWVMESKWRACSGLILAIADKCTVDHWVKVVVTDETVLRGVWL